MCLNCAIEVVMDVEKVPDDWRETIQWPAITPAMAEGVLLIQRLYDEDGLDEFTGGPLHVYLDDYNCEDRTLEYHEGEFEKDPAGANLIYNRERKDADEIMRVCRRILEISWQLSEKERITMLSCAHDGIPPLPEESYGS
jgi:hypothetical protein